MMIQCCYHYVISERINFFYLYLRTEFPDI
jgi:hypothetical protein